MAFSLFINYVFHKYHIHSDFLLGSFSFDEKAALNLLSDYGEVELLLSFAKARGLVVDALNSLVKFQTFSAVPFSALNDLVQRGFTAHLIQSGLGKLSVFSHLISGQFFTVLYFLISFCVTFTKEPKWYSG